ncbi:MAG TPA: UDP-N-acetylglucosamine 2-epimerase (non-hydrolyzing) [Myxococcota bacterium]|nr:UDP-N-acetylglucosamine 2-epimerase (non-hydrolyzing) [Myxococcota bacterium]HRY93132.1 UDP-N-acetylglucosamine 2-epimerase (non-hydrolyzing) [Myxococcota bacterium]
MLVHLIAGARPNFMKVAPIHRAAVAAGLEARLIHTGQHYDPAMSQVFLDELGLPAPHRHLEVGSGSHAEVTARALERLEKVFQEERPDWVLVVGDVNSTLAGALAAVKLGLRCAHVEAGLRSGDRAMPEELNRLATDAVCDLLLVSEPAGLANLRREGKPDKVVRLVGNTMIDTLDRFLPAARARQTRARFGLPERGFALCTLHRPSNVDDPAELAALVARLQRVAARLPVVFPVHPRTRARLAGAGMAPPRRTDAGSAGAMQASPLQLIDPLGYLDFVSLMADARVVLTDSGGIQEETTALGVPCLTLRDNTERPITVDEGTNQLVGAGGERLEPALDELLSGRARPGRRPALWDGHAAERIVAELVNA